MNRSIWISLSLAGIFILAVLALPACNSADRPVAPGVVEQSQPCGSFGDTNIEATSAVNTGNVYANKYNFSGGKVTDVRLYTSGAGQIRLAIYADGGAAPSTLIAQSAAVSTLAAPGWTLAALSATLPSGNYWLSLQTDANVSVYYTLNFTTSMPYIPQAFGAFPASYTGYTACACSVMSVAADFCP